MLIVITWVFFRAGDFSGAYEILYQMFHFNASQVLEQQDITNVLAVSVCVFLFHFAMRNRSYEDLVKRMHISIRAVFLAMMLVAICLAPGDDRAFIYFQF